MNIVKTWRLLTLFAIIGGSSSSLFAGQPVITAPGEETELTQISQDITDTLKPPSLSFEDIRIGDVTASIGDVKVFEIINSTILTQCKGDAICNASININTGSTGLSKRTKQTSTARMSASAGGARAIGENGFAANGMTGQLYDYEFAELDPANMTKVGMIRKMAHVSPTFSPSNHAMHYGYTLSNGTNHEVLFLLLPIAKATRTGSRQLDQELAMIGASNPKARSVLAVFSRQQGKNLWKKNAAIEFAHDVNYTDDFVKKIGIKPSGDFLVILGAFKDARSGKRIPGLQFNIAK